MIPNLTQDLYVSGGYGNSRVHKYDPRGRHLVSWGGPGTDPGCFNLPHNIATDAEGLVYVADRENHRVQIFDGRGQYLGQWNNLHRPCGLHAERRDGGLFYVGELPTHLAVNKEVPNLGARVSILMLAIFYYAWLYLLPRKVLDDVYEELPTIRFELP